MSISAYKLTASSSSYPTLYFHPSAIGDGAKALNANAYLSLNGKMIGVAYYASFVSLFDRRPSGWPTSITLQYNVYASVFVGTQTTHSSLEDYGSSLYTIKDVTPRYPLSHTVSRATLYTRDFTAGHGGTVAVGTGIGYSIGACAATPTASANHVFVEWRYADHSPVTPVTGITIDSSTKKITIASTYAADVAVYAYFTSTVVTVGAAESGNGTVSLYIDGTKQAALTAQNLDRSTVHTVRVVAEADYGYLFYRWGIAKSQDGGTVTTSYDTTADYTFYTTTSTDDLITVTGHFVSRPTADFDATKVNPTYGTLSVTLPDASVVNESNNALSLAVYQAYAYTFHAVVTDPAANYFLGWFSDPDGAVGHLVSADADYAYTITAGDVTSGITLYAVFREKADVNVTPIVLLNGTPQAVNRDGNLIAPVTAGTLKAGFNDFAVTINTGHYWGKPDLTVTEMTIGGSAAFNTVSIAAADYTVNVDGNVSLNLSPIQAWVAEQDPIEFEVSADFPAEPVGATVVEGANEGTYSWMYDAIFTAWTSSAASPDPTNPLYGDAGTITITTPEPSNIKIQRVTLKYGETVAIDQDTVIGVDDEEFVITAAVTGPITLTIQMKATVLIDPATESGITFAINAAEVSTADVTVGIPCSVSYTGTPGATVFEGWDISGFEAYVDGNGAMVASSGQSSDVPLVFTPNGNTTAAPSFVTADAAPYVAVQFYNASTSAVFVPGGSNPTCAVTGGSSSTYAAMLAQVVGTAAGNFFTTFAQDGSTVFYSFAALATVTLTAAGTTALPFLKFEKLAITKGDTGTNPDTDCVIGSPQALSPVANPYSASVIVSCAYRAVFGAYLPQTNTATFRTTAMRAMGAVNVTGYDSATALNGSVSAKTGYGDAVTFSAAPNVGYTFSGWYSLSGSTYTLVSALASYTLTQDATARTLYASFAQDTTKLYLMGGGTTRKTGYWKSKRYEMARPSAMSACRADADGYPLTLQAHAFSSPASVTASDACAVTAADQGPRRMPSIRKERFFEFSAESVNPVTGMSFSTTMQGLS